MRGKIYSYSKYFYKSVGCFSNFRKQWFTVNSIQVRGNDKTKSIAIIRELALSPGDTFDLTGMNE